MSNCGYCGEPTSGYSGIRYFGTYVAHNESDCLRILKGKIETLTLKLGAVEQEAERIRRANVEAKAWVDSASADIKALTLRLDALRHIVSDWRACPGSDSEYGIETAFNKLVETLERDVERRGPVLTDFDDQWNKDLLSLSSRDEEERGRKP